MNNVTVFEGIEKEDVDKLIKDLDAKKTTFNKESIIITNIQNINLIGIILEGSAAVVKYERNGERDIIEKLNKNDLFGEVFTSDRSSESYVVASSYCEVLFIDYNKLVMNNNKNCHYQNKLINNILQLLSLKIAYINDRIEVLSKRSIREKLRAFFEISTRDRPNRSFVLSFSFTDLADYLSIDRSAMTREIKHLKDEGFITIDGKRITLMY